MSGLRPYELSPLNRGCVQKIIVRFQKDGQWIDKTDKKLFLTAKSEPWDSVMDDSSAVFKVEGTIPEVTEPGRIEFAISETQSFLDPNTKYYCDIVETDDDGTSNANRVFIGQFDVIGGANNQQAGGEE